ncbi:glycosyltransferase [Pseudactinotalea sp.]|uniref:glycosyltransferase n=1 Tax=Pseudactinotalea sp. TaxID=1926260 RepID=UPI003B3ABBAD
MTDRRRRVCVATRIFAPEAAAAAFRLDHLVRALAETCDVEVLTVRAPEEYEPPPRVRVRRWPVLRDGSGYVRGYLPYLSFDLPLALRLLFTRRPDVVVVEPPPTTGAVVRAVCAMRRIPYVWYAADVWSDAAASTGSSGIVVRVVRAMESWVLRGAAASLAVSDGVADRVRELGARDVTVVGNGVDTDVFCPEGESRSDSRTLVYAGTASEWQGADVFVRAMPQVLEQVPDARLVYLGQGSAMAEISRLASELPDGVVRVLGSVSPAESAAWLRGAAGALVSIVPGQGYDFAIPTKVFAALGTGTPVLYAGVGPVVEILADGDLGESVEHDVDAVAASMAVLLRRTGISSGARSRRADWVLANRSLPATAARAREVVQGVSRRRFRRGTSASRGRLSE